MPLFSHSKIGTFENCPLQYKYAYIDKVVTEQEDTVETFMGGKVHDALEKLYTDLKHEKLLSLKELLAYYNKEWKENWNDTIKITKTDYTQENYRKIGERCITEYYERYKPFNQAKVIGIETKDQMALDDKREYKFHIRIDRLDDKGNGRYEVHDYKTNASLPKQEYLDKDRQLAMYSLWVKRNFKDFKEVKLVWHFLNFDKDMESSRTASQLEDLRKATLAKIKEIEATTVFKPNESALCNWCAYQDICPLWKHEVEVEKKELNEYMNDPGVKLVNEYVRIKAELKEFEDKAEEKLAKLEEALIDFAQKNNFEVIAGSDNKVTVKETESVKFPAKGTPEREALVSVLKQLGKLDEVSDLDVFALKKVVKESAWDAKLLKALEEFEEVDKDYRFSVRKK